MPTTLHSHDVQAVLDQARRGSRRIVQVGGAPVEVRSPYPTPEDWRDKWIYFLLVDRFNNPDAPPAHDWNDSRAEYKGGNLKGIRAELDYLKDLGVGALWLSPVLKNPSWEQGSYHGYGIQDFLTVNPRFASDPEAARLNPDLADNELRDLVDEAHARGIRVILDIVLNHAGNLFGYASGPPSGENAETFWHESAQTIFWRDENGVGRPEWTHFPSNPSRQFGVWPSEFQNDGYFRRQGNVGPDETRGDFHALKELVTEYRDPAESTHFPVRELLISAYQYLIARFDVDGFRIDTLKFIDVETERNFGNAIREYALSLGKKNFFTFGEVWDSEEKIAQFIGRNARTDQGDLIGVDAALDFPLFETLPAVIKGWTPPVALEGLYAHRKATQQFLITSHAEASRYFVTFLDNHDLKGYRFCPGPGVPAGRFDDQLALGIGCLFTLQGIPCLYYGTEQGLTGNSQPNNEGVREALWGKANAFNRDHPFYKVIQQISQVRAAEPALRYGRQYFRPISGDGFHFGPSIFDGGVTAFARILNDREVVVVANAFTGSSDFAGEVLVDRSLNPEGTVYEILYSNKSNPVAPQPVRSHDQSNINGQDATGPIHVLPVTVRPMEIQILAARR